MADYRGIQRRLAALERAGLIDPFREGLIGLEKEALRVSPGGNISVKPHPGALGSALTHPYITTDFSEALLELITPPLAEKAEVLSFLDDLHVFVHSHLEDEFLWGASMPCILREGSRIPLARYGNSNAGLMKTLYRRGLGYRYGRHMQVIAGVHYNFSFTDAFWTGYQDLMGDNGDRISFSSESYMGVVRNLQRFGWLIPYLFGASPAVCKSFVQGDDTDLVELDSDTLYYPFATSLRLGDIGYQNRQEEGTGMKANYDSLDAYIRSLSWAIQTPCPHYEAIGVKVEGRYRQLNANVLQIENEYYSTVRPKPLLEWLEKPTQGLRRGGIRYVEVRSFDLNAFEARGVSIDQLHFMEVFTRFCLLCDSPRIKARERRAIDENLVLTAHRGREPGLQLEAEGRPIGLRQWALELLDAMIPLAEMVDGAAGGPCMNSLSYQRDKILEPALTPSARMLAEMATCQESFLNLALNLSMAHRHTFLSWSLTAERLANFQRLCLESQRRQQEIEAADDMDFDEFLNRYLASQIEQPGDRQG